MENTLKRNKSDIIVFTLLLISAMSVSLLLARIVFTNSLAYLFLAWNLFLAWIPVLPAYYFRKIEADNLHNKIAMMFLFGLWLVFFPNAAYIFTDFIHMKHFSGAPFWFDLILLLFFSFTGIFVGFVSLNLIHQRLKLLINHKISWLIVIIILFASAFGVFLGRFYRWNSWDLFVHPFQLLNQILDPVMNPFSNKEWIAFTFGYGLFLTFLYVIATLLYSSQNNSDMKPHTQFSLPIIPFLKGFLFAISGIKSSLKTERNLVIHFFAATVVVVMGLIFRVSQLEWVLIALCICAVIAAELFNTSIEILTNIVSPSKNEQAKRVKDISAGAVLILSAGAFIVGSVIFIPKILGSF